MAKLVLLTVFASCVGHTQPLSEKDYIFGPLTIRAQIKDFLPQLGEPRRISVEDEPLTGGRVTIDGRDTVLAPEKFYIYEFDSLRVHTNGFGYIQYLKSTKRGFVTPRGIQVGDSIRKIKDVYGQNPETESPLGYVQEGVAMGIWFDLANDKVIAVAMGSYIP